MEKKVTIEQSGTNKKLLFGLIGFLILSLVFFFFRQEVLLGLSKLIGLDWFKFLLSVYCFSISILYDYRYKEDNENEIQLIKTSLGKFMNSVLNGATYSTVLISGLFLLNGVANQLIFPEKIYFVDYDKIDLILLLFLTIFILYYIGSILFEITIKTIFKLRIDIFISEEVTSFNLSEVQEKLNKRNYSVELTGKMDAQTSEALRKFQTDNKLPVDGRLTIKTLDALEIH